MNNRPRCRDWSPLATQQLRLRNLIQISGHNIVADANKSIYFTLHLTLMSAPFFTSERLESFRNAIWAEINCQSIQKSTSQFVVVRVWQTTQSHCNERSSSEQMEATRSSVVENDSANCLRSKIEKLNDNKDKILFVWGIYFSGLVPITKRSDVKYRDNALVFYIHGGFFTSAEFLLPESKLSQYEYFYQTKNGSSYGSSLRESVFNNTITKFISINTNKNHEDSLFHKIPSENHEKKDDIFLRGIRMPPKMSVSPKNNVTGRLSPSSDVIESCSHKTVDTKKLSNLNPCENGTSNDHKILKVRFLNKDFYRWEIRQSYNVKKLLILQEKQRTFRREMMSANEVMEKICMKSASCLNLDLIANKGMIHRPKGNPSIGRTLNRLLSPQPESPRPEDLLKAQNLRRRIETAKFRCRFLTTERDRYKVILRKLHAKGAKLSDENIEKESWLMDDYRELSRSRDMAIEQKSLYLNKCKIFENVREALVQRQHQLLKQIKYIYVIKRCDRSDLMEINGICLPNTDALRIHYSSNLHNSSNAASNLSVAMCYVAHVVLLCSSVLNIPLRNKIIFQGSASKIRDDIKVLSEHDREFPLFCRYIPPSDSLLYAAFLLNQNISQIKFMLNIHNNREDLRATLPNLMAILSVGEPSNHYQISYAIQESINSSHLAIEPIDQPMSSISEASIDMIISIPAKKSFSISEENIISRNYRGRDEPSRTRRSFSNDDLASSEQKSKTRPRSNTRKNYGSEPILSTGRFSKKWNKK